MGVTELWWLRGYIYTTSLILLNSLTNVDTNTETKRVLNYKRWSQCYSNQQKMFERGKNSFSREKQFYCLEYIWRP